MNVKKIHKKNSNNFHLLDKLSKGKEDKQTRKEFNFETNNITFISLKKILTRTFTDPELKFLCKYNA